MRNDKRYEMSGKKNDGARIIKADVKITNIDLIEGIIEEKYINYSNLGSNIIAKNKYKYPEILNAKDFG